MDYLGKGDVLRYMCYAYELRFLYMCYVTFVLLYVSGYVLHVAVFYLSVSHCSVQC